MNKKQWLGLGLVTVAAIGLAACGNRASCAITLDLAHINYETETKLLDNQYLLSAPCLERIFCFCKF